MAKRDHSPGKLAAVALRKLANGSHADGGGLYLLVRGTSRSWVYRYVGLDGNRKNMGLGSLEAVSLADARKAAAEKRAQLRNPLAPVDPLAAKREAQQAARVAAAKRLTFKECAEAFLDANETQWSNPKHRGQWRNTLETYAYPTLGDLPIADIDTALVCRVLEPIWQTKTETATRVRGRIEKVLDYATVRGYRTGENPARWKGHLQAVLPAPSKVAKVEHHEAMAIDAMPEFMKALRKRDSMSARALEFAILTAARSGEVRGAEWSEIDLEAGVWIVPAERMKAKREHRVPLAEGALKVLKALPHREGVIFPNRKAGKLSDMALLQVMRKMDLTETPHGFRSTFRDWASERTNYDGNIAEAALAHTVGDKVEAAYRRGDLFEKRRAMMADWDRFCERGNEKQVITLAVIAA